MLCCTAASAIKSILCQVFKTCYATVSVTIFAPYKTIRCTKKEVHCDISLFQWKIPLFLLKVHSLEQESCFVIRGFHDNVHKHSSLLTYHITPVGYKFLN